METMGPRSFSLNSAGFMRTDAGAACIFRGIAYAAAASAPAFTNRRRLKSMLIEEFSWLRSLQNFGYETNGVSGLDNGKGAHHADSAIPGRAETFENFAVQIDRVTDLLPGTDKIEQFDGRNKEAGAGCGEAGIEVAVAVQPALGRANIHASGDHA